MAFKHLLKLAVLLALVVCISSLSQQEKRIQKATALFLPVQHGPAKFNVIQAMSMSGVFGSLAPIGEIVQACINIKLCDFSSMNRRTVKRNDYLHIDLAPSYGKLDSDSSKIMDYELKVMLTGTNIQLSKVKPADRSWNTVVSIMMQNPLTEPLGEELVRTDRIIRTDSSWFTFSESTKQEVVNQVLNWFIKLIQDEDILQSTKIDINAMATIVAHTGARIDGLLSAISSDQYQEQEVLDIGILRYPDIDQPYFKLYRIHLKAWEDASRVIIHTANSNGITGELYVRKFKPRSKEIERIRSKIQPIVDQGIDSLFHE